MTDHAEAIYNALAKVINDYKKAHPETDGRDTLVAVQAIFATVMCGRDPHELAHLLESKEMLGLEIHNHIAALFALSEFTQNIAHYRKIAQDNARGLDAMNRGIEP